MQRRSLRRPISTNFATRPISPVLTSKEQNGAAVILWEALTEVKIGLPTLGLFPPALYGAIRISGTFNGGTYILQGSADGGATFETLTSAGGTVALDEDLAFTAAGFAIVNLAAHDRFQIANSGEGSSEDVDVNLILAR